MPGPDGDENIVQQCLARRPFLFGASTTHPAHTPASPRPGAHVISATPNDGPPVATSQHQTVLVVEDDAWVRRMLRRVLERAGHAVTECAHGAQALELLDGGGVRPSLVITDMVMPVMGGAALATRLRQTHPDLPVLAVSGYSRPQDLAVLGALAVPWLEKPITPQVLMEHVNALLR